MIDYLTERMKIQLMDTKGIPSHSSPGTRGQTNAWALLYDTGNVILLASFPSAFDVPEDKVRLELQLAMLRSSDEVTTMEASGRQLS